MVVGFCDVRPGCRDLSDELEDLVGASFDALRGATKSLGEEARRLGAENRSLRLRLGSATSEAGLRDGGPASAPTLGDAFTAVVPAPSLPTPQEQPPWLPPGALRDVEDDGQSCPPIAAPRTVPSMLTVASMHDTKEDCGSLDGVDSKSEDSHGLAPIRLVSTRAKFEILPLYNHHANFKPVHSTRTATLTWQTDQVYFIKEEAEQCVFHSSFPLVRKCVISPHDGKKGAYDICSLILVFYDTIIIPLQMMNLPSSVFVLSMQWVTRLFWTIDMPLTSVSGVVLRDGNVEMRPTKIFKYYAQSWFALDLLLVFVDWTEVALNDHGSGMGVARVGKFGRAFRLIRMVRLLRLLRIREVLYHLVERIQNESMIVGANIFKIMCTIAFLAHLMGCLWATVGQFSGGENWLVNTGYDLLSFSVRYTVSLHWSLSQFTGGMDEVTPAPTNLAERAYAIASWFLAFMLSATFLSSLTCSMTQLYLLASAQQQQVQILRRYLHRMHISKGLTARVQRNVQHALKEQNRSVSSQSVELLKYVSDPLRVELHFEMYGPALAVHPFFQRYSDECPPIMRKVCHNCVKVSPVSAGDVIFHVGERPARPQMYLVLSGSAQYISDHGKITNLGQGHWISEAVLWTTWTHQGVLTVTSDGRMCTVDARHFHEIVAQFQHHDFSPKVWATEFVERLNHETQLSDLLFCDPEQTELKRRFSLSSSFSLSRRLTKQVKFRS